jgi:hypothetical protein
MPRLLVMKLYAWMFSTYEFEVNDCHILVLLSGIVSYQKLLKLPYCPHEKCKSKLEIGGCKKFLNPEVYLALTTGHIGSID